MKPITASFGGEYVVMGGAVDGKEGNWAPTWPVIIAFPTIQKAQEWYQSEENRPLKELRQTAGEFSAVLLDGLE